MASSDQTASDIFTVASNCLRTRGKVPEVGDLIKEIGIPRRSFYRSFRNKAELAEKLIRDSDQTYYNVCEVLIESSRPPRDRMRNFLDWRMMHCVWYGRISRPDSLGTIHKDRIEQMLRGLLRETWAGRVVWFPIVYEAATQILDANDRVTDDLLKQLNNEVHFEYVDELEGVNLTDEGLLLCESIFDPHWAFVSNLLSAGPAAIDLRSSVS
jgi:hypothetical protein